LPFHGVGGKRIGTENWIDAIQREVLEEIGVKISIKDAVKTRYITTGAELESIGLSDSPRPYCIYKRTREADPNFSQLEVLWLVGFEAAIDISDLEELHPRSEVGALVCLTGDMLRKTLHEKILYTDIINSSDGSRLILGKNVTIDYNKRAVPAGLATIVASEQRPRLFKRL